jgi:hypothetical protein
MRWVSIDPGDRHVGFATWVQDECLEAVELTPSECVTTLEVMLKAGILEVIVYEKFALYAWNEKSMAGNEFITSQLIGIIKYLANRYGVNCVGQFASEHKRIYKMGWFKDLTPRDQRALPWWGNGAHAKDAWCIGTWFVRQRKAA